MTSLVPVPTPIYRFLHIENLEVILKRGGVHAPNFTPADGLDYKIIHDHDIQMKRRTRAIPCGKKGVVHDYVPFYFGPRSPMLLALHTGRVQGYTEKQDPLIYLVTSVQAVDAEGLPFVFSDGHGVAALTWWSDDLRRLDQVDWEAVNARWWQDTNDDMDRQRRKQAEFLVHRFCPWHITERIGVLNRGLKEQVEQILSCYPQEMHRPVEIRSEWYY